jgi:F-type H+-transporting ATPase subunit b
MIALVLAENSIQLVPDGTLLVHVAAIVVMVYLLNSTVFKPINTLLAEREKRGTGRFAESNQILKQVDQKLASYEQSLRAARGEAYQEMETEHAAVREERERTLARMKTELSASTRKQKQELERQADEARTMLQANASQFAQKIGTRILGRQI